MSPHSNDTTRVLENPQQEDIKVIPTGSPSLDLALGIGGIPRGRIMEVYGDTWTGKTSLAFQIIGRAQKNGGRAVYISDVKGDIDLDWARRFGVDVDALVIDQPGSVFGAVRTCVAQMREGAHVVVIDSIAGMPAYSEPKEDEPFEKVRFIHGSLRKLVALTRECGTAIVFVNPLLRSGITKTEDEATAGGMALRFYAWVRIQTGGPEDGSGYRAKVIKNAFASIEAEWVDVSVPAPKGQP